MAVTITAIQLAAALRLGDGETALVEPQLSQINRVLASATALVEDYAPNAPEGIQNEAAIRLAAYLYDAPPGASQRFVNAMANSGAQALLARFRVIRATKLDGDGDTEAMPAMPGGGIDEATVLGLIADWAEADNTELIPQSKIPPVAMGDGQQIRKAEITLDAMAIQNLATTRLQMIAAPMSGDYILPHHMVVIKSGGTAPPSNTDISMFLMIAPTTGGLLPYASQGDTIPSYLDWNYLRAGNTSQRGWLRSGDFAESKSLMPETGLGSVSTVQVGPSRSESARSISGIWEGQPLTLVGYAAPGSSLRTPTTATSAERWAAATASLGDVSLKIIVYYEVWNPATGSPILQARLTLADVLSDIEDWALADNAMRIPAPKLPPIVTAAVAKAGTSTEVRSWTSSRVKTAIKAYIDANPPSGGGGLTVSEYALSANVTSRQTLASSGAGYTIPFTAASSPGTLTGITVASGQVAIATAGRYTLDLQLTFDVPDDSQTGTLSYVDILNVRVRRIRSSTTVTIGTISVHRDSTESTENPGSLRVNLPFIDVTAADKYFVDIAIDPDVDFNLDIQNIVAELRVIGFA